VPTSWRNLGARTAPLRRPEDAPRSTAPSCEDGLAAERNGRQRQEEVRYGSSTALITWTIPFDAEMSVAAMPAAESASRVSVPPLSIS